MNVSTGAAKLLAVVDTNLFVSGLLWANTLPSQLLDAWLDLAFHLVTSLQLRAEVTEVLSRPKFSRYRPNQSRIADALTALAATKHAVPLDPLPVRCRDAKDDKLLACALGGQVDYLVSGDGDLLDLNEHPALGSLRIVTPREFLTVLGIEPAT